MRDPLGWALPEGKGSGQAFQAEEMKSAKTKKCAEHKGSKYAVCLSDGKQAKLSQAQRDALVARESSRPC